LLKFNKIVKKITKKDKSLKYLSLIGDIIYFPCFDEYICRNRLINICKIFVRNLIKNYSGYNLKKFLSIMIESSLPYPEVLLDEGELYIIRNNQNAGILLFKSFQEIGYSSFYIGKKIDSISVDRKDSIIIEKKPLIDEVMNISQISFHHLDELFKAVAKFVRENNDSVIMLNSLDDILYINSFKSVISFLQNISDVLKGQNARCIFPGNLLILNEDEVRIIQKKFNLLTKDDLFHKNEDFQSSVNDRLRLKKRL